MNVKLIGNNSQMNTDMKKIILLLSALLALAACKHMEAPDAHIAVLGK